MEPLEPDGDVKYWRSGDGIHHVPKRPLDELIVPAGKQESGSRAGDAATV